MLVVTVLGGCFGCFQFFCSGEGRGESGARRRGGVRLLIENPRRGGQFCLFGPKFPPRVGQNLSSPKSGPGHPLPDLSSSSTIACPSTPQIEKEEAATSLLWGPE